MQRRSKAGQAVHTLLALAAAASVAAAAQQAPSPTAEGLVAAQTPVAASSLPDVPAPSVQAPVLQAPASQALASQPTAVQGLRAPAADAAAPAAQALQAQAAAIAPASHSPAAQAAVQLASVLRAQQLGTAPQDPSDLAVEALGPAAVTLKSLQQGFCQSGAPAVPVVEMTIAQAHTAMLEGRLNCSQLVGAYLQRIVAFDQLLQLNSIRSVNPASIQVAIGWGVELQPVLHCWTPSWQHSWVGYATIVPTCEPSLPSNPRSAESRRAGRRIGGHAGKRHQRAALALLRAAAGEGQH